MGICYEGSLAPSGWENNLMFNILDIITSSGYDIGVPVILSEEYL